jgi:hypothetical protein
MVKEGDSPNRTPHLYSIIKALAWPALALVVLVSFWTPLHQLAAAVPDVIKNADTIKFKDFSVLAGKRLSRAPASVAQVLNNLTAEDIDFILTTDADDFSVGEGAMSTDEREQYDHLASLGLLKVLSEQEMKIKEAQNGQKSVFAANMTPLYKDVRRFLRKLMSETIAAATSEAQK